MPIVTHISETGQVVAALPSGVKVGHFCSDAAAYQYWILDHYIDQGIKFTVRTSMTR